MAYLTLDYEWIEAITICHNCQNTYSIIDYGRECPYCHSGNTVLLQGNECLSELPRLTIRLEVRASCFYHHCLAGNLTALSGLHDVYKRYIRLIPSLYVLY